jgi:hypothetical protein
MVGHRLVIEARDDMQVGMEPSLIVPAERVTVGSKPLVQLGSHQKQKFPRRRPLLRGQVKRRSPVDLRHDAAAARNDIGRITRVSSRGVDAEVVLEVQVRLAQPVVIAKDATFGHRTVLRADCSQRRDQEEDVSSQLAAGGRPRRPRTPGCLNAGFAPGAGNRRTAVHGVSTGDEGLTRQQGYSS